jgi:Domain of unknown function (DUF4149)
MWYTLRIIVLGLWVGAMAGFAFIFAPLLFAHTGPTPQFAATIAACVRAIVRAGNGLAAAAAVITVIARLEPGRWSIAIVGCLVVAALCGTIEVNAIVPQMERTALLTPAYEALHRESSGVYGLAFLSALGALVLSARPR